MNKVILDNLPRRGKLGKYVDWNKSVGYEVPFVYNSYEGVLTITKVNGMNLRIKHNKREVWITRNAFLQAKLNYLLKPSAHRGAKSAPSEFKAGQILKDENRHLKIIKEGYRVSEVRKERGVIYECQCCGHRGFKSLDLLRKGSGCAKWWICRDKVKSQSIAK